MKLFFFILFFYSISVSSSFAYIDPGIGSIILQTLIGVLAAISVTFSLYFNKIKIFFNNLINKIKKKK
jgi:hypothetical protein